MLVNVLTYLVTDKGAAPLLFFRDPGPALEHAERKARETGRIWTVLELGGTENVPHPSHAASKEERNDES